MNYRCLTWYKPLQQKKIQWSLDFLNPPTERFPTAHHPTLWSRCCVSSFPGATISSLLGRSGALLDRIFEECWGCGGWASEITSWGVSTVMGRPQARWMVFVREIPSRIGWSGGTHILGNHQLKTVVNIPWFCLGFKHPVGAKRISLAHPQSAEIRLLISSWTFKACPSKHQTSPL